MSPLLILILAVTVPIHGRTFNNPILQAGEFFEPGAIKVNNTYYIVTSSNSSASMKMPIYMSNELSSWGLGGYIFDEFMAPRWALQKKRFLSPKIYEIGNNYHVYFTATDASTQKLSIGVATAPDPLGPYTATDRPLLSDPEQDVKDPAIIEYDGHIYLIWVSNDSIKGRMLNSNGVSFFAHDGTKLLDSNFDDTTFSGSWHTFKNPYHYIIYSEKNDTMQWLNIARSSYPLGPYENQLNPILTSAANCSNPGHVSLVKDLNDKDDIMVLHGIRGDESKYSTFLATVSWPLSELQQRYRDDHYNYYGHLQLQETVWMKIDF